MTLTIEAFGAMLRRGDLSAAEATDECLRRIEADNPTLNAFIHVMADEARRDAREADARLAAGQDLGPLHGVPISVKDLVDIRGVATTAASRVRDGHRADEDAPVIAHLRRAGAVLIGKTNLHEFAFGTTNEDSAFGPAGHPLDPTRSPGGSSGGSAISVATGMALGTVGTDTGGSIRIPAAACGVVGLKPTYGELPVTGVVPLSQTLDHVGPLARSVTDAWHLYHALRGRPPARRLAAPPLAGLRLVVLGGYFLEVLHPELRAAFDATVEALVGAGARVSTAHIAHASLIAPVYLHLVFGDAAAYHAATLDAMPERYTPPVRQRLELARYVMAEDYVRALAGRDVLTREASAALADADALVLPTLPVPAPPRGAASVAVGAEQQPVRNLMLRLTQLFNLTGQPAISLPFARSASGLPFGLQLAGARGQTEALLRTALAVEGLVGRT